MSIQEIIQQVAEFYNVDYDDVMYGDRRRKYSEPRHVAMYLMHRMLAMTNDDIAAVFSKNRVLSNYAVKKVGIYVEDPRYNRHAADCVATILRKFFYIKH